MKIVVKKRNGHIILGLLAVIVIALGAMPMLKNSEPSITTTSTLVQTTTTTKAPDQTSADDVKVEVYHFHATRQCYSCKMVGSLAEKTVNTYFKDELASGMVSFDHINYDLPENRELSVKYGVSWSSLFIGTTVNGQFTKEENTRVWYKINDEDDYLAYLKEVLDKRLRGELS